MKVTLISWPNNPLKSIHCAVENMNGNMIHDMESITKDEALATLKELKKTKLNGAIEFGGDYIFQIEGVPRAFTHQIVRNRVGASYSQESMRFAAKTGNRFDYSTGSSVNTEEQKKAFEMAMNDAQANYEGLLDLGVENQDARGALPINTNTKIGVRFNLMTLVKIAEVRLCYQSQGHWRKVVERMKEEISEKVSPEIASLLVKICDRTGKCEFKSLFDRHCPIEDQLINDICKECDMLDTCDYHNTKDGDYCQAIKKLMLKEDK
jgi:thymidylate synthase (FAD)